ncbi:MAG: flavin reductase family protein [Proteobacteria bacterium]|nr:flavin reductase family protein [Pseudomonadota bacterium]MDA0981753.1 flavin reductase family protein [Pseudomonadota bacterium]
MELELATLPALERYKLLIGLVIPRPIGWVSTFSENGVANCAPFSFFNVISEDPPLCILSINLRSDGTLKHTLKNIRRTGEYVVNLADESTANAMHISSTEAAEDESEFTLAGLTPVAAAKVKHPRIMEAAAALECRVERRIEFGPERELVIGEIVHLHARDGIVDPVSKRVSEENYHPIGRLFASRYCTTRERFNLPGKLPGNPA